MSVGGRRCRPWVAALGVIALVGGAAGCSPSAPPAEVAVGPTLDAATAGRFAALALDCVHREYPNKIAHVLGGDEDVAPPRVLTPAFYGCYDWHSSVHGHWLLARVTRLFPDADYAAPARAALGVSLTDANLAGELRYLEGPGRVSFERPYGLAWLLQLAAELREWAASGTDGAEDAAAWSRSLAPLETAAAGRFEDWLPKLSHPIRIGEHSQTAFALGLALDWARIAGDESMEALILERSRDWYAADRDCPLAYEPSGHDFLSPCLAEADLMRRVMPPEVFAVWLDGFMPGIPTDGDAGWLRPETVTDPSDPKLAHLDGLNLSRAWMLDGIAMGLPGNDPRLGAIVASGAAHAAAGLASVTGEHYEGGHWLGSFATYLVTRRGLKGSEPPPGG
jgi:hypothetical protein